MVGLKEMLLKEQIRMEEIMKRAREGLRDMPEGSLRLSKTQNSTQYYHCTEETGNNGSYIPKANVELIQQLAQKSYNKKILRCAEKRFEQIRRITKDYNDREIQEIYESEHRQRQGFIEPIEPIWSERLKQWQMEAYQGKEFREGMPMILTERGERVRSKSEKIMADYFLKKEIAYKYECPIYLRGFGIVYPDFTFLSPKTGDEIYWEHDGKMDDPIYARSAVRKIHAYEENGIYPGENLIITYETEQTALNTKILERLVNKYLII